MNIRSLEDDTLSSNLVKIKNSKACYSDLSLNPLYDIPEYYTKKIIGNPGPEINGRKGIVVARFRHTKGWMCYAVQVEQTHPRTGPFKYIVLCGRTGIKRYGKITAPIMDWDSKIGKRERKKYKRRGGRAA